MSNDVGQGPPQRTEHACGDLRIHIYNTTVWEYDVDGWDPTAGEFGKPSRTRHTVLVTDLDDERAELTHILVHGLVDISGVIKAMQCGTEAPYLRWDFIRKRAYFAVYP